MFAFIYISHSRTPSHIDAQDLTGQVIILPQPGMTYRWVIGTGGFATVYRGEWRPSEGEPLVISLTSSLIIAYSLIRTADRGCCQDFPGNTEHRIGQHDKCQKGE